MENIALEIIEKVNSFYSSAFSQLMTLTIGIIAFVGVFVPVLVTFYQNRRASLDKAYLEEHLENKINELKANIIESLKRDIDIYLKESEAKHNSQLSKITAGVLYVQACHQLSINAFEKAAESALSAINSCVEARDELNMQRSINLLLEQCFPNLKVVEKVDIEELNLAIEKAIENIKKVNTNGRYVDTIEKIKKKFKELNLKL